MAILRGLARARTGDLVCFGGRRGRPLAGTTLRNLLRLA
jgi:hypothetical protein